MDNFIYSNPVKLLFGKGQLDQLAQEILPFGNRVLLIYGRNHIKTTGIYDRVIKLLKEAKIDWIELEGVESNPKVDLVRKGIRICKDEKIDFILAVGGGSCSDTAKAISMGAMVDYDIWEAYEDFHNVLHGNKGDFTHIPAKALPIGVVMTKAATGSEFDYTTVLSNRETSEKLMIINKVMYPKFSIDDPELMGTLPPEQVAYGVADIMTHIFEQYFTSTPHILSLDRTKEGFLKTVMEAGVRAWKNPQDDQAQGDLLYVAAWACSDFSMTGTLGGWDSHMIEHEITAISDVNHGLGMAIVYIGWMKFMVHEIPAKFAHYAEQVWGINRKGRSDLEVGMEGIERTAEFWKSLGIPLNLKKVVDPSIISQVAKQTVRFGPIGVVKPLHENDVRQILESVI